MYISAKYYLNWFLFHTVIMKVLGVNFLKHSVFFKHDTQIGIVICGVHMAESLLTGLVFTFYCACGS